MQGSKQALISYVENEGLARLTITILAVTCVGCLAYTWGYAEVWGRRALRHAAHRCCYRCRCCYAPPGLRQGRRSCAITLSTGWGGCRASRACCQEAASLRSREALQCQQRLANRPEESKE